MEPLKKFFLLNKLTDKHIQPINFLREARASRKLEAGFEKSGQNMCKKKQNNIAKRKDMIRLFYQEFFLANQG